MVSTKGWNGADPYHGRLSAMIRVVFDLFNKIPVVWELYHQLLLIDKVAQDFKIA